MFEWKFEGENEGKKKEEGMRKEKRTLDDTHGRLLITFFILEFVHGAVAFDVEKGPNGGVDRVSSCFDSFSFSCSLDALVFLA